ncbi:MAG: hypothetical protein HY812_14470, partial [Planctomycetes bacterium]|nr:hypothetical protein [Planctomycetota bacterium]
GARHALVAGLFALLLCAFFFERRRVHAFSQEDRGVFPADYGGGPFLAVLLAAGMGLLAAALVEDTILFLLLAASLALAIRLTYAWKRRRAYSIRSS